MPEHEKARVLEEAHAAVELGVRAGADDVVAAVSWKRGFDYEWREGRLEKVQESTSRRLGIVLYVDGRYSNHGTNDLEPSRLARFVEEGVALTRYLEPDPHRKITPPELYEGRPSLDLDLFDASLLELDRDRRIEWCRELCERARDAECVVSATSGVADGHSVAARVSSNGFEGAVEHTGIWLYGEAHARDGERRPEAGHYVHAAHLEDLPTAASVGDEVLRRVLRRLGAEKLSSRRATMVLDPEAGSGFIGRVTHALAAGEVQQQRSYLAKSLDRPIASPLLTVTDDPLRRRGLGSRLFDGEGIAARRRTIVEKGVLRSFYVDTYYGRKLGWAPTTGSSSNVVFEHGERGLSEILAAVGEGIYVNHWLGGNADMTTGDFSFGLQGHVIENGELGRPITEMNVTGNYADVLGRLVEVGNDPVSWSSFRTPTLVFEDVQFSGS